MRKLFYFFIASFFVVFISCSRDSDSDAPNATTLQDKWTMNSYKISNFENTGNTIDDWDGLAVRPTIEFKSNGKSTDNFKNGNYRTMSYTATNDMVNFEEELAFDGTSYTSKIVGNKMTLTQEDHLSWGGGFTEYTIVSLTKN